VTPGPRRMCVACREVRAKGSLVRLVRGSQGTVVVDRTGRTPGRGAYVCGEARCAARLVSGGRLSQAFRRPSQADAGLAVAVGTTRRSGSEGNAGSTNLTLAR
jgi:predicted RNA-binding protein YlxR (DUF448 family)